MSRVLFCGGHADGTWRDIPDTIKSYKVAVPGKFRWDGPDKVETEEQEYRIYDITLLGWHMKVATLAVRNYEDHDVIRALLQRDVYDHLTKVPRPVTRG